MYQPFWNKKCWVGYGLKTGCAAKMKETKNGGEAHFVTASLLQISKKNFGEFVWEQMAGWLYTNGNFSEEFANRHLIFRITQNPCRYWMGREDF